MQQKWEKMRQKGTFRHRCWPGLRLLLLYPAQTRWSDFKKDENTIDCPQLPEREQHLRKGSVSRCRTLRGKPSGNSSPGGTYRIMQNFIMMKTILKARRLLCCYKLTTSESSKFSRSPSTSSRSSVDLLKRQDFEIFQFFDELLQNKKTNVTMFFFFKKKVKAQIKGNKCK